MKTRSSMYLALLGIAMFFTLALASAVHAQPGEFVKGVLQPLADGFPKRAITMVVVDDPGSIDDLYAKSLQSAAKSISPVNILVSDEPSPTGGNWYTIHEVTKRDGGKDGYYPIVIGGRLGVVTDLIMVEGTRTIGAKLEDLNMIIGTEVSPYVLIQRKNAPWGPTLAGMFKYGKENPGKLRYIPKEVGTGHDIIMSKILRDKGIEVKKIPQGTYQEVASTIGAGEGDFSLSQPFIALPNWQAGRVDCTMITSDVIPKQFANYPTIVTPKMAGLELLSGGTSLGLGAPSEVPQAHVDWLFKLFKAASETELHRKRIETNPGLWFKIEDGATLNADNRRILKEADPLVRGMGLHLDQLK